ncbi:MAG: hypothetical protein VXY77_02825 [Pseudomonadota bacterium]|nr:hypothetical protein [Pseudomonadota bacterium]
MNHTRKNTTWNLNITDGLLRFSNWAIKSTIYLFLTTIAKDHLGENAFLDHTQAASIYHKLISLSFIAPVIIIFLSDWMWGKFKLIRILLYLQSIFTLGLLFTNDRFDFTLLIISIAMIIYSSIKAPLTAFIGDQAGGRQKNRFLVEFLFIEIGVMTAEWVCPWVLINYSYNTLCKLLICSSLSASICFSWCTQNYNIQPVNTNNHKSIEEILKTLKNSLYQWRLEGFLCAMYFFLYVQVSTLWQSTAHIFNPSLLLAIKPYHINPILTGCNFLGILLLLKTKLNTLSTERKIKTAFILAITSYLLFGSLIFIHSMTSLVTIPMLIPLLFLKGVSFALFLPELIKKAYQTGEKNWKSIATYRFYFSLGIGHSLASLIYQNIYGQSLYDTIGRINTVFLVALISMITLIIYATNTKKVAAKKNMTRLLIG